ncbi:MAG: PEP-CTERM sorting domain-containing protein [Planctomycetota bacterium]
MKIASIGLPLLAFWVSLSLQADAAITLVGDHSPMYNGVSDPWEITGQFGENVELTIGGSSFGTLAMSGGSRIENHHTTIGRDVGAFGSVFLSGAGTQWDMTNLRIGIGGRGEFEIRNGAFVNAFGVSIGPQNDGFDSASHLIIDGPGSSLNNRNIDIGIDGSLEVSGGGSILSSNQNFRIGTNSGSTGYVSLTGESSSINVGGDLEVNGFGVLDIADGGLLINSSSSIGGFNNSGAVNIRGDRDGVGSSVWSNTATMEIENGGTVNQYGGRVIVDNGLYISRLGLGLGEATYNLFSGVLDLQGSLLFASNDAVFNLAGGFIENPGGIDLGQAFVLGGGGVLSPGNSPGITQINRGFIVEDGTLKIELDALTGAGVGHDQVIVYGEIDLLGDTLQPEGDLEIQLNFAPELGNKFIIVDNDGNDPIVGEFIQGTSVNYVYEDLQYELGIDYAGGDGNDIVLTVLSIGDGLVDLAGDHNGDGFVSQADLDLVLLNWGDDTVPDGWAGGVSAFDGAISQNELDDVLLNWGDGTRPASSAIPEPSTLAVTALLGLTGLHRRHRYLCPQTRGHLEL